MKTILHVGMTKTGSTALQGSLAAARPDLKRYGILYPESPDKVPSRHQHLLTRRFLKYDEVPQHVARHFDSKRDMDRAYRTFLKSIPEQAQTRSASCLVMSSEHLFRRLNWFQRQAIRKDFLRVGLQDTEIALYIRRPSSRYLSMLQQGLKGVGKLRRPRRTKYRGRFRSFEHLFGKPALKPKVFARESLHEGDILKDFELRFLSRQGVPTGTLRPDEKDNVSLSAEGMLLMEWLRRDGKADPAQSFSPRKVCLAVEAAEPLVETSKPKLNAAIAEQVDYGSDEVLWLQEEWGLTFHGYDYDRIRAGDFAPRPSRECAFSDLVDVEAEGTLALLDKIIEQQRYPDVTAWAKDMRRRGRP